MKMRTETDSLGEIKVPAERLWGAQAQRSLENFAIGSEKMPREVIYALAFIKKAAALANCELGSLPEDKKTWIASACDRILDGSCDFEFPLSVWQTGSGTQTNMNVNEVISNLCCLEAKTTLGSKKPVHPNDDINMSQSSNDVFPAAMHIASYLLVKQKLLPALNFFLQELKQKATQFSDIIKVGRTHLMDAAPLTLGQEFSGYATQIEQALEAIEKELPSLAELPLGATAVGTGLNAHPQFGKKAVEQLAHFTNMPFELSQNHFAALAAHDALVSFSGALKRLACALMKIANDVRWMASGPRAGLAELFLPANEPGSSIMPGKVNPTQCEAMTMVAVQVLGNDAAVSFAGASGNFELNVFKPLIIFNILQSIHLLSDAMQSFCAKCLVGLKPNCKKINHDLTHSLMLATALNRAIGYDSASKIVKKAFEEDLSLKEAAVSLKILSSEQFDSLIDPSSMVKNIETS